ncbi:MULTISPECIES: signal peptidase I [Ferrimonas]|uniref:signal peptidase I n=1 Tax=Ferrimonas TaxID=44011 RepID=UPI0003FEA9D2|nr:MULTISPECIES: signal peptidase I [Ferrimonas]USD38373.1 signal peptidase I [Ferrimonas sp. SCSIO 43195]
MAAMFSLILVLITLGSGLVWLLDHFYLAPKRQEKLAFASQQTSGELPEDAQEKLVQEPWLVETSKSIFPVIAFVLILRSFLWEPFQIPSGSMMPTLLVGDFILVNKHEYGLRDPVFRYKFWDNNEPQRGDIVVFKYPKDTRIDYIKRVIGLPGDKVVYRNKQLFVQPKCEAGVSPCPELTAINSAKVNSGEFSQNGTPLLRLKEDLMGITHDTLINPRRPEPLRYYYQQQGRRTGEWVVPEGHYFVMGDNRDNSTDGRFWGFVPEENLVGQATGIWISFEFDRDSSSVLPGWVPTGVRFNRIGGLQ